MAEQAIRALLSAHPDILWGFADTAWSPYGTEYPTALVVAVPYGEQLTPEDYTEPRFEAGIQAARAGIEALLPQVEAILTASGIRSWIPPVAQRDETELLAPFPFKTAAARAGLGWFGKNDVIITRRYGPRVRLSAMLIGAVFAYGRPVVKSECPDDCTACVDVCPCKALKNHQWTVGTDRSEMIDYHRCNRMRSAFIPKLGRKSACGLCLTVCPVGRQAPGDAAEPAP